MEHQDADESAEPVMYRNLDCCLGRQKAARFKPAMKAGC
jgi:hypothetical protein